MERRKSVAIDFDGVIRNKETDGPVDGALEGIAKLLEKNDVVIFTARDDLESVRIWLEDHHFPKMKVTNRKPVAKAYLDDHAVRFEGSWQEAIYMIE